MARARNDITLIGTLTQNPELKYTPGGLAILELNLGGNDHVIGDDGAPRELAWYHRSSVFGAAAETLANQLKAGDAVYLEGALNYRAWEAEGGVRRSALDVKALRVERVTTGTRKDEATVTDAKGQARLKDAVNEVRLIGNLTKGAELRYTPAGHALTRFPLAINERFKDRSGADQERTHFVEASVWRELAEACGELAKGDAVFVVGRLVNDAWTDQDGSKRYTTRVEASRVEFLERPASKREPVPANSAPAKSGKKLDLGEEFPPEADLPF